MGNTHRSLSSLIVFAMLIAMRPVYRRPRKPPNVRTHYQGGLILEKIYGTIKLF
jgi:hypothetical protein